MLYGSMFTRRGRKGLARFGTHIGSRKFWASVLNSSPVTHITGCRTMANVTYA